MLITASRRETSANASGLDERRETPTNASGLDERLGTLTERILGLYQGPFLSDEEDFGVIVHTRNRLRARVLRQPARLGEHRERRGDQAGTIELYRRIFEQDALAEDICRRLMRCYLSLGLRAEAFAAYRSCRLNLSILLGIEPAAETRALAESLKSESAPAQHATKHGSQQSLNADPLAPTDGP